MKKTLTHIIIYVNIVFISIFVISFCAVTIYSTEIGNYFRVRINNDLASTLGAPIDLVAKALANPKIHFVLDAKTIDILNDEIGLYIHDPVAYVTSVTDKDDTFDKKLEKMMESATPTKKAFLEKIVSWRGRIRDHFDEAFFGVRAYLQVFLATNIFASLFIFLVLQNTSPERQGYLLAPYIFSAIIVVSTLLFIDQDWFYSFARSEFPVSSYPTSMALVFIFVYLNVMKIQKLPAYSPPKDIA